MFKHASTNRFYRLVWSHVNACWVAVAEGARGRGKSARRRTAAAVLGGLMAANGAAAAALPDPGALPTGGQVVAGQAQVTTSGNTLTVNQGSAQAILNWQSFDIGAQAAVRFNQPSASAVALNRVVGTDPSRIYGQLSSNGKVFLINANGVLFGAGAQVNVGGLVASSLGLSDQNFLNGQYDFNGGAAAGEVRNEGSIRTAHGGVVALLAPSVINSGSIVAPQGAVAMAAGERIGMDLRGDGLITVQVARGALAAAVANKGLLQADKGQIILTAGTADLLARSSVNNTGLIQARGLAGDGGSIRLVGDAVQAGDMDVASRAAQGGAVDIQGGFVALDGAIAAGGASGGKVTVDAANTLSLAGSTSVQGQRGQGGAISYRAASLVESNSASTNASGATNGGTVSVHADGALLSSGSYAANGGTGIGGRIDLSGASVRLLGAKLDASGATQGGLVRVGGAFQGGLQRADAPDAQRFTGRWGQAAPIASAQQTFVSDASAIDVSAKGAAGQGGTAVVWSDDQTTMLGSVNATGPAAGGAVEISSKGELRHVGLENLKIGAGGSLLLDPKNITIGLYPNVWTYQAILGNGFNGGKNFNLSGLDAGDNFGFSVALNAAGDRLAVGAPSDNGFGDLNPYSGAVRLFSFTDANFSGAQLQSTIGAGYTGGKNVDVALADYSQFGSAVAFNASANMLAVGALGEDAVGTVRLINFTDSNFTGGSVDKVIRPGDYALNNANAFGAAVALNASGDKLAVGSLLDSTGAVNGGAVHLFNTTPTNATYQRAISGTTTDQQFGTAVALSADGTKLAVGAVGADNSKGAVYLYNNAFTAPTLRSTISSVNLGGLNMQLGLRDGEMFGSSVSLNAAGTVMAVGSAYGGGFADSVNGPGAVRVFDFYDSLLTPKSVTAVLGRDFTVGANADITLDDGDTFGFAVALNGTGDRLVIGAPMSNSSDGNTLGAGQVHAYSLLPPPPTANQIFNSTKPKASLDSTINAATLAATLATGVNVTLQANNDIILESGSAINVGGSTGGALTMQAGRSVLLYSSINTSNGNLTAVANETTANGVVNAYRDAGLANIYQEQGTTINAGTGHVKMTIADGAGKTNLASGVLSVEGSVSARDITLRNLGTSNGSSVVITNTGAVTGTGGTVEVAASGHVNSNFNNYGSFSSAGRYLVYSGDTGSTTEGVTGYNKHYNQGYTAGSTPAYAATGNWFFYREAPTLFVSATSATRVYDGSAGVPALGYNISGLIDGDTAAILSGALAVTSPSKNVGLYSISQGTLAQSLGYTINYSGNLFTITQKSITAAATGGGKIYDGNTSATVTLNSAGKVASDALTISGTAVYASKDAATGKTITVSGMGLSGADAGNYSLASTSTTTTADITARSLTASATAVGFGKVYDGNTAASVTLGDNRVAGDVLTLSNTAATYNSKDVGNGKSISVTGITMSGADAGNYTLAFNSAATNANITARTLTATVTGVNKTYDGLTAATVNYGDNRVAGDVLSLSGSASFLNKNAASGKTVNVTGMSLSGTDAGNYTLASTVGATTANIGARTLNAGVTASSKVYDGNMNAGVTLSSDKVAGDVVTLSSTSAAFGNKDVGTGKTVTVGGIAISGGADAANYTLASATATGSANITARSLTATATGVNKTYDGALAATVNLGDNRVAGDVLTLSGSAAFGTKDAGTGKAVSVTGIALGGADAGNYTLAATTAATTANITARSLSATATGVNKVYDGALSGTVNFGDNRVSGDVLTLTGSAVFGTKDVGTGKAVSVTGIALGGTDAGNYTLAATTAATTADITARSLTATATGVNKIYDGALSGTVNFGDNRVTGDVLTLTGSAAFGTKDVGTGKAVSVTGIALGGTDAGNYTLAATTAGATADITARSLTATATGTNKTYDGLLAATVSYGDNRVTGDVLTLTGSAVFGTKDVGTGKAVSVTGMVLGGADAGNYTLASASTGTTADITARSLTATATGVNKIYDGALSASVNFGDNRVAGDVLTLTGNAGFGTKDVGTGKAVSVTGIALGGTDAGNYTLTATTAATNADITARSLTATATGVNKVYDGALSASVNFGDNRVTGDVLTLTGSAAFGSKDVGTGKAVSVTGIALGGTDAGNYTLAATTAGATADITARLLTATATGVNKTYDGSLAATVSYGDNRVAGDVLTLTGNAGFGTKDVGTGKAVSVTGMALGGLDAGNYTLASTTAATTADITVRTLNASATGVNKTYDGTLSATVNFGDDRVAGDMLTLSGSAGFGSKDAANGKAVSVSAIALGGLDAGNYTLASTTAGTTADITARSLTATATGVNKTYDGALSANVNFGDNRVAGDVLTLSGSAAFGTKDAATGKAVTVTGIALGGLDAGNYTLASTTAATTADITARSLNATATGVNKVYDGALSATVNFGDNRVAGDIVTLSGNAGFGTKDAGTGKAVSVTGIALGGADAGNYTLASATVATTADITARSLTATATGVNKTYDGALSASVNYADNRVAGDALTLTGNAAFGDKHAGTGKAVSVTGIALGGLDAGNYTLASTTTGATADITQRTLNATATGVNKTYDGTVSAAVNFGDDRVAGDLLALSGNAGFGTKDAGVGKTVSVSGIALSGADAGNYVLAATNASTTASIAQKALAASLTGTTSKVYDGSTAAAIAGSGIALSGFVAGEGAAAGNIAGVYNSANVVGASTVNAALSAADLSAAAGTALSNYAVPAFVAGAGVIVPKTVSVTGLVSAAKIYDGSTVATLSNNGSLAGLVGGEQLVLGAPTGISFDNRSAGSGKLVTASGYTLANGNGGLASNYVLASSTATAANGVINQASLVVSADNKERNAGTANPAFTFGVSGLVGGDSRDLLAGTTLTSTATETSSSGPYAISASGPALNDYQVTYVDGVLNVLGPTRLQVLGFGTVAVSLDELVSARSAPVTVVMESVVNPNREADEVQADGQGEGVVVLRGGTRVQTKRRGVRGAPQ